MRDFEIWLLGTLFFILRYGIVAGLLYAIFYVWLKKKFRRFKIQKKSPSEVQVKSEIIYSLITMVIYGLGIWLFLFWIKNGKTRLYHSIDDYGTLYFFASIFMMILVHDTYFYWTHRMMHHKWVFKYIHLTHHRFNNPTPWAAFAFHPLEALISLGIIPVILFLIPYHQWALSIFVTFLMVYNSIIHLGFQFPFFTSGKYQNSARDHNLHHQGFHVNYGLYFNIWDKVIGTYRKV